MTDPIKCSNTRDENTFQFKDIARHSNGISILTVYCQNNYGGGHFISLENFGCDYRIDKHKYILSK